MRTSRADALRNAVHSRGLWTRDLRDAAHETHHALVCRLRGRWSRDRIDDAMVSKFPRYQDRLADELLARAVEQIVCKILRVKTWTIDKAVDAMIRESAALDHEDIGPHDLLIATVRNLIRTDRARRAARRVLSLAGSSTSLDHAAASRIGGSRSPTAGARSRRR